MFELKVTIGTTPELSGLLSGLLGYMNRQEPETVKKTQETIDAPDPVVQKTTKKAKADKTQVQEPVASQEDTQVSDTSPEIKNETDTTSENSVSEITVVSLRQKVADIIKANRETRDPITKKFEEFGATNPTTLAPEKFEEFWNFLTTLE